MDTEHGEYVSRMVLELQPRSRRGCRRLFGIRENAHFNIQSFDIKDFTKVFLTEYNRRTLQRGEHIKFQRLIVAVKLIERAPPSFLGNTHVDYCLRGMPINEQSKDSIDAPIKEKKKNTGGIDNQGFVDGLFNKNPNGSVNVTIERDYSCYCSECKCSLSDGDLFIKSGNWSRPILCVSCYENLFAYQCVRCSRPITFDHDAVSSDGLACIRYVEHNGFYWHSDCCVCVICLKSLIGEQCSQDCKHQQLFCVEHIPD